MNIGWKKIIKEVFFAVLLVIVFSSIINPFQNVANENLDPSWQNSYNYFFNHSIQFGNQIAFTYGPLAFLYVKAFDPTLYWLKILFTVFLAISSCIGIFYIKKNINLSSATLLSIGLIICIDHDSFILSLQLLLTMTFLFRKTTTLRKDNIYITILFALIAFLGLIKFTFWVGGLLLAILFTFRYIFNKDWRRFPTGILSFIVFSIIFWLILKQNLEQFLVFIKNSIEIAGSYNEAMSISGTFGPVIVALFIIIMFIMVAPLQIIKNFKANVDHILLLLCLLGFSFLSWKHGFVRQDLHKAEFYSLMTFVYAIFFTVNSIELNINDFRYWVKTKKIIRYVHDDWLIIITSEKIKKLIAIIMIITSISAFGYSYYFDRFAEELVHSRLTDFKNAFHYVFNPKAFDENKKNLSQSYAQTKEKLQLPQIKNIIKNDSVDIYNYNQNYIIYNDLNWNPRPIFQSYSAYSSKLLEINKNQLIQTNLKYILFNNQTIDNRFPLMDDSLWIREMLHKYTPILQESGLILFQKTNSQIITPQLVPNKILTVELNKSLDIQFDNDITYAKLDIAYNLIGKIRALIYKPAEVYMGITLSNNQEKNFRVIPGMAKVPFILSPLNETNDDVLQTLAGLNTKTIKSIKIYSPTGNKYFKNNVQVTLYEEKLNVESNTEMYQTMMWSDIIKRPANKIIFEHPLERVQAYDTTWMLFHPKAEMNFALKSRDRTAHALIGIRPEAKEVGKSDGVTFYWEANLDGEWIRLSSININQDNFKEKFFEFVVNLPNDRKYNMVRLRVDYGPANNSSWDWAIIKDINIE